MRRFLFGSLALLAVAAAAFAHVGSPNVYYEGDAGPHRVRVVVRPPTAIPGTAETTVSVAGERVEVSIQAIAADAPPENATSQVAQAVPGVEGMYSAELWLLEPGAYAVRIHLHSEAGHGEAVVPINAVNREPQPMPTMTAAVLAAIAVMLVVGAGVLASLAFPGLPRRGAGAAGGVLALVLLAIFLRDWAAYDRNFRGNELFEPMPVQARALVDGGGRYVELSRVPDARGSRAWPRLVTDHGKLMHAFLIREPTLDAFAHVHPRPTADGDFLVAAPALPPGRYRVYADITLESGLSETLSAVFDLPDEPDGRGDALVVPDPDDSQRIVAPVPAPPLSTGLSSDLGSGYTMRWEDPEIVDDPDVGELRFLVVDGDGRPARLQPYMGMLGHAAVRRLDGAVFAHLHPVGSISMASQEVLARRDSGGVDHSGHAMDDSHAAHRATSEADATVSFPFEFPKTGPYRIWIQVKVADEVLTGVFDAQVERVR